MRFKYLAILCLSLLVVSTAAHAGSYEDYLFHLKQACDRGDERLCIRFGFELGKHQERADEWHHHHPEWYGWDR